MIAKVCASKARFCGKACRDGFQADRRAGMCYGLHFINDVVCQDREQWSLAALRCAYCSQTVPGRVPKELKTKFDIGDDEIQINRVKEF